MHVRLAPAWGTMTDLLFALLVEIPQTLHAVGARACTHQHPPQQMQIQVLVPVQPHWRVLLPGAWVTILPSCSGTYRGTGEPGKDMPERDQRLRCPSCKEFKGMVWELCERTQLESLLQPVKVPEL